MNERRDILEQLINANAPSLELMRSAANEIARLRGALRVEDQINQTAVDLLRHVQEHSSMGHLPTEILSRIKEFLS